MFRLKRTTGKHQLLSATEDDKENRTPTLQEVKEASMDHALTMPRVQRAAEAHEATGLVTPCFMPSTARLMSQSEPIPKVLKNITNTIGRPAPNQCDDDLNGLLSSIADVQSKRSDGKKVSSINLPGSPFKTVKKSKTGVVQPWPYSMDNAGCRAILKVLKIEVPPRFLDCMEDPIELFHHLELNSTIISVVSN